MPNLTLIIGNKNYSSWSLRPWVLMKQNNIPFQEDRLALFTDEAREVLSLYNSDFKVPLLKDGDLVVWDSLSILEYLSEQYLDNKGWPSNVKARAVARSLSAEMHSSFNCVRNELPMNCRKQFQDIQLSAGAESEIERIQMLWNTCREEFGEGGEWLFGEYSIADAMFAPIALRLKGYNISVGEAAGTYIQSVLNQPCIKEWIEAGALETEVIEMDEIEAE